MTFFYFGFECRASEPLIFSWYKSGAKQVEIINLLEPSRYNEVLDVAIKHQELIWVSTDAQRDLICLQHCGVDVSALKLIDTTVEAKMLCLTHPKYSMKLSTVDALADTFKLIPFGMMHSYQYATLLAKSADNYPLHQLQLMQEIAKHKTIALPRLLHQFQESHQQLNAPVSMLEMLNRGKYLTAASKLYFESAGFPIDQDTLHAVFSRKTNFIRYLQNKVNGTYGELYNDVSPDIPMVWNETGFSEFIKKADYQWQTTNSGSYYDTSKSYFKEKARHYPELRLLHQSRKTIDALKSSDLVPLLKNGHIKAPDVAFNQRTGRNSPKPSQGFMLNLPPWLRSLIKPKIGNVMIGVDWCQQEIGIAAALSGDKRYQLVYNDINGDVYLGLAKLAGAVPQNATKISHPYERQAFKAVQLGIGYGKGVHSLALDIFTASRENDGHYRLTFQQAILKAEELLIWHRQTFSDYWNWIDAQTAKARKDGYIQSIDGWTYFVTDTVRDSQLQNFPMQANGAAMMRKAVVHAANRGTFDLICTLHDAIYANATESNAEFVANEIVQCMDMASHDLLNGALKIRTEVAIYNSDNGYFDERGTEVLNAFSKFLNS